MSSGDTPTPSSILVFQITSVKKGRGQRHRLNFSNIPLQYYTSKPVPAGKAPSTEVPVGPYPYTVRSYDGRDVPVVQAFAFGKYLGHLKVTFDAAGNVVKAAGNPILLDASVPQGGPIRCTKHTIAHTGFVQPCWFYWCFHNLCRDSDPDILADISRWKKDLAQYSSRYVGQTLVYLNGTFEECRFRECNLGNLICDAMVTTLGKSSFLIQTALLFKWLYSLYVYSCGFQGN